jgi:predicted RNase H-related nuclease YkuK (DUF458 family)
MFSQMQVAEIVELLATLDNNTKIYFGCDLDPKHGSNCAASEAAGYVLGVTGLSKEQIKFKPDAPAASFGADQAAHGKIERHTDLD